MPANFRKLILQFCWMAAFMVLLSVVSTFAQLPTATILGTVKDPTGAVMPQATITARNTETDQARTTVTGEDGSFRLSALPVGHYTLKIEKPGFKTETQQGLVLNVSQELVLNATL